MMPTSPPIESTKRERLSREASQSLTRDRLLDAAHVLFVRDGYNGTSLRDIAAQAGYSQGAFYSNFRDKAEVLLALLQRQKALETARATAMLAALEGSAEAILAGLDAWSKTLDETPTWCVLSVELQLQAARDPAFAVHYHALWETQLAGVAGIVDLLFSKLGRTPPAPSRHLAAHYMALIHGAALQRISAPTDASIDIPTDASTDTPTDTPADIPTDASTSTSAATMLFLHGLIALSDARRARGD